MSSRKRSANAIVPTPSSGGDDSASDMRASYTSFGQVAGIPTSIRGTPVASACAATSSRRTPCMLTRP